MSVSEELKTYLLIDPCNNGIVLVLERSPTCGWSLDLSFGMGFWEWRTSEIDRGDEDPLLTGLEEWL